ncbi:MAG: hypothetical protein ACP5GJ_03850 [Nanopusillaceae archaeon]|jgi:hypothetical protein
MGKHMLRGVMSDLILTSLIALVLAAIVFFLIANSTYNTKSVEIMPFGTTTLYIYHINGNTYACTQNITGETCLVAHNTLICPDTTCLQIYNIVNIT